MSNLLNVYFVGKYGARPVLAVVCAQHGRGLTFVGVSIDLAT